MTQLDLLEYGALIVVACAANALSQLLLKWSAAPGGAGLAPAQNLLRLLISPVFWGALWAFAVSISIYAYLLSHYDATFVFPSMALTHVFVFVLSAVVLRERVSVWRYLGTAAIAFGFAMMIIGELSANARESGRPVPTLTKI